MEASIVFHFAGRGVPDSRLSVLDFAQLLDPRWRHPSEGRAEGVTADISAGASFLQGLFHSTYNFVQGGKFITEVYYPGRLAYGVASRHLRVARRMS